MNKPLLYFECENKRPWPGKYPIVLKVIKSGVALPLIEVNWTHNPCYSNTEKHIKVKENLY